MRAPAPSVGCAADCAGGKGLGRGEVGLVDDVVAVEHAPRLPAAEFHGDPSDSPAWRMPPGWPSDTHLPPRRRSAERGPAPPRAGGRRSLRMWRPIMQAMNSASSRSPPRADARADVLRAADDARLRGSAEASRRVPSLISSPSRGRACHLRARASGLGVTRGSDGFSKGGVYALERPEGANGRPCEISKCACTSTCTDISPLACTPENGWCISAVWKSRSRVLGVRLTDGSKRGSSSLEGGGQDTGWHGGPFAGLLIGRGGRPAPSSPWEGHGPPDRREGGSLRPRSTTPGAF